MQRNRSGFQCTIVPRYRRSPLSSIAATQGWAALRSHPGAAAAAAAAVVRRSDLSGIALAEEDADRRGALMEVDPIPGPLSSNKGGTPPPYCRWCQ